MFGSATGKSIPLSDTQQVTRSAGSIATRKIWLPKFVYDALPWFYLASGIGAFFTTLYISEWFWILPHYVLFSAACLHLGIVVLHRRRAGARRTDADEG